MRDSNKRKLDLYGSSNIEASDIKIKLSIPNMNIFKAHSKENEEWPYLKFYRYISDQTGMPVCTNHYMDGIKCTEVAVSPKTAYLLDKYDRRHSVLQKPWCRNSVLIPGGIFNGPVITEMEDNKILVLKKGWNKRK